MITANDTQPKQIAIEVSNMTATEKQIFVGISPKMAVISAYAQSIGDFNTFDYERKYGDRVHEASLTFTLGNFAAFINPAMQDRDYRLEFLELNPDFFAYNKPPVYPKS